MEYTIESIAHIENGYTDKFGIPRQSGLSNTMLSKIYFEEKYRNPDYIRGIEDFSHLWLIWQFSENREAKLSPTVRPPRLGGNVRKGVFATRSPFRPNFLGLSSVELVKVDHEEGKGPVLYVKGADLLNGTPIFDIKPYIPMSDSRADANGGFSDEKKNDDLNVNYDKTIFSKIPDEVEQTIIEVLKGDPRPGYHNDPDRVYGFNIYDREVKFKVSGKELFILSVE